MAAVRGLRDKYPQYRAMVLSSADQNLVVRIEPERVHLWGARFAAAPRVAHDLSSLPFAREGRHHSGLTFRLVDAKDSLLTNCKGAQLRTGLLASTEPCRGTFVLSGDGKASFSATCIERHRGPCE